MDFFNSDERPTQKHFAAMRDRLFSPVVTLLIKKGITPNQISLTGVMFLMLVCFMPPSLAMAATACMAMYVLCDGLDGPLARQTNQVHAGGSLIDIIADHLGIAFLPAAAIYHLGAWGPAMVLFASSYLIFIGLTVYANGMKIPLRKFIRSKYLFFLLYLGSLFTAQDLVTYFCGIFFIYYSVEIIETLRRIYRHHAIQHAEQEQ
ncbi:CDP-alcohol phosphatidyltransferase family protein [uncultured Pseudodesulfovibrio sp.]|uniref:CDP-alcohol phosphatidyltransferase family protein n=1 Tax=uncultured Pseudodesulfovibrio sp. TaxID=2035858 RepID=UPI0029C96726|nr:CDP-alcohol phosphatidyltransferase family protein [uncultured Pseudodesulfovibrio sp.]